MSPDRPIRTQGTFEHKRMVWPYIVTTPEDGERMVEVRDPICPRCRGRASVTQTGDRIVLECRRCNISAYYSPFGSLSELKDHVKGLILDDLA